MLISILGGQEFLEFAKKFINLRFDILQQQEKLLLELLLCYLFKTGFPKNVCLAKELPSSTYTCLRNCCYLAYLTHIDPEQWMTERHDTVNFPQIAHLSLLKKYVDSSWPLFVLARLREAFFATKSWCPVMSSVMKPCLLIRPLYDEIFMVFETMSKMGVLEKSSTL